MVVCQLTIKSLYYTYLQKEVHEHADCGLEACMCTPVDGRYWEKHLAGSSELLGYRTCGRNPPTH